MYISCSSLCTFCAKERIIIKGGKGNRVTDGEEIDRKTGKVEKGSERREKQNGMVWE
jgi:hypothetical protein